MVSLLASFSYMDKVGFPINGILQFFRYLLPFKNREFVRNSATQRYLSQTICKWNHGSLCNAAINFVLGPSVDQKNNVSLKSYLKQCAVILIAFDSILDDDAGIPLPFASRLLGESVDSFRPGIQIQILWTHDE